MLETEFVLCTFSTILRRVLMLRIHQPTPTALSSDHCGSPLCMAGIMFSSSSSASEWKAQAKWHVDRPAQREKRCLEFIPRIKCTFNLSLIPHNIWKYSHVYVWRQQCLSSVFTLVEQLHAVERGQGGEQAGVQTHGQQVPQSTLIESLSTYTNTTPGSRQLGRCYSTDHSIKSHTAKPFKTQQYHLSSCDPVGDGVPEPPYPLCAYLALEQPANVYLSKD